MKVTMKDIAKEANVSVATVSRVINGTKPTSEETYKKIMDVIKKYNYVPNSSAQNLRQKNTKTAALIVSSFPDSYITNITKAVGQRAREYGYRLLFIDTNEQADYEQESIQLLTSSQMVDGLILSPTSNNIDYLQPLIDKQFPIVLVNRYDPDLETIPRVTADDYQAGFDATNHLLSHGHKHIGVVYNFPNVTTTIDRLNGYKEALKLAGIPYREDYLDQGFGTVEGGMRATERLLKGQPDVTALFIQSDLMTIGAISALKNLSLRWPDDVSLIGFGDFEASEIIEPPITNVNLPPDTIGKTAFDALLNKMSNPQYNRHIQLPTSLIVRKSCGTH
ncbi:LacI family transcriptional regulator [Alkalihalobacillus oceani]|uniref:LacI family DNA-binding transcriptional regulator n=1 Tax=Halalkalibacter oceani TaxID=1653776 RepID=UPI0020424327|nr:LacI family DNA-binding transcriptional regulator [Halalkalibacter oceani]MCM3759941.1 LacI family transcriptional regulator [Halalkalibacter oceani]